MINQLIQNTKKINQNKQFDILVSNRVKTNIYIEFILLVHCATTILPNNKSSISFTQSDSTLSK